MNDRDVRSEARPERAQRGSGPAAESAVGGASSYGGGPSFGGEPSYGVGIVNYHSYDDLEECLDSVKSQALPPAIVLVVDADSEPDQLEDLRELHPEVVFVPRPNLGYAAGANEVLRQMAERVPNLEFALVMNPDVELDFCFTENLLAAMARDRRVALATGKLLRPDGITIDSAGIVLPPNRRPRDRGSEEIDRGQYDSLEYVFGASGAALMVRFAALEEIAIDGEVFDEDFFMYHEDTDLAWRSNLLGWRVLYVPTARASHARCWRSNRRFLIPETVRRHSFKNHYLQMIKNEEGWDFVRHLPVIAAWEAARFVFALVRDRAMFSAYREALQLAPRAWSRRRWLRRHRYVVASRVQARPVAAGEG